MTLPINASSVLADDVDYVQPVPKKHAQRSSIQHWQLRDLIACPQTRKEVYYVNQNNVFCYNTETKQVRDKFSPTVRFNRTSLLGYSYDEGIDIFTNFDDGGVRLSSGRRPA